MDRIKFIWCISVALVGGLACGGCGTATAPRPELRAMLWHDGQLDVEFDRPAPLERVVLRDEAGRLLLDVPEVNGRTRYHVSMAGIRDALSTGESINVDLFLHDSTIRRAIEVPPPGPPLRALIAVPAGELPVAVGESEQTAVAVPAGGVVDVSVVVESSVEEPTSYELTLRLPDGLTLASPVDGTVGGNATVEDNVVRLSGSLQHQFDFDQVILPLEVADSSQAQVIECELTQRNRDDQSPATVQTATWLLHPTEPESLAAALRVEGVDFPTDARGNRRGEQLADTVVLPSDVWNWLRRRLRPTSMLLNPYAPFAYQTVRLANEGGAVLDLVVEADVRDVGSDSSGSMASSKTPSPSPSPEDGGGGQEVVSVSSEQFAPPQWLGDRSTAAIRQLVHLPAGESAAVTLPFFVRPDVPAGRYRRHFRVLMVGAVRPVAEFDRLITVRRGSTFVSATVAASAALALAIWLWWFARGRRLVGRVGVDGLAVIAVFATTEFAVSFASRIGGDVLAAVLGPFSMFVSSLGSEVLASLLLAAVVVVRPLPGVALLTNATVFLLNALFSGQFGVADLWFVTISIGCCELALWTLGVTRRPRDIAPSALAWRVALAIGLANGATLLGQFCIVQVLYRLFFADWYIAAVVVITGLGYGALGGLLGTTLGLRLRRVTL